MGSTEDERFFSKRGITVKDFPNFMLNYGGLVLRDTYNKVGNPEGIVNFGVAENTLCEDILTKKLNSPELNKYEKYMQYYFEFRGLRSFREALATFLEERFKASKPIDPDNLIVTSGVGAALDLLAYMICDPGDCSLVFAPYYAAISADLGMRGEMVCIPVQMSSKEGRNKEAYEVDLDDTEKTILKAQSEGKRIRFATVLNPHNPTGDILSKEKLIGLLNLFNKYDMHVVMDEIYALSLIGNNTFTSVLSLESLPCPEKTHFVWGFAKDFALSGFRCGVIYTLQKDLAAASTHLLYMASVPAIIQNKLTILIRDTKWLDGEYLPNNRKRLNASYAYCKQRLEKIGVSLHEPKAALFAWVDLRKFLPKPTQEEEMKLFEEILETKVYCVPGTAMFYEEPGWFRFTFAHKEEYLKIGFDRLETILEKRRTIHFANSNGIEFVPGVNGINGTSKSGTLSAEE